MNYIDFTNKDNITTVFLKGHIDSSNAPDIEKEIGVDPPRWTVYFKANQADALTAAFKEYTKKDLSRESRPSMLEKLHKFKELAQALGKDRVKNKEHGGPER